MTTETRIPETDLDVAVVGAGYAGSLAALKAAELGLRVGVFDARDEYPDNFRAEKLETDQYEALERLGAIHLVRPEGSARIDEVISFQGNKRRSVKHHKHRGMDYRATVNSFRDALRAQEIFSVRKVTDLIDAEDQFSVVFDDERSITARVGIVATGGSNLARKSLSLAGHDSDALRSTSFGFHVESDHAKGFPFQAFNAVPDRFIEGLQFATFFPIGDRIRVNLFTCWHPASGSAKGLRADPMAGIREYFPRLESHVGPLRISGAVQVYCTHYYRQSSSHLRSTALIGDEFQSVSPATGMGISKCVTDTEALAPLLADLRNERVKDDGLSAYYADPKKREVDDKALHRWAVVNEFATSRSLTTRFKKIKRELRRLIFRPAYR